MTRIFVVDDSAFIRKALARVLESEPGLTLVGQAASGAEALEKIPDVNPDLVTLDVAMPGMDGLEVLRALLRWKPGLKVVMLSAHTSEGAEATVAALAAGSVDFIDKASFNLMDLDTLRCEVIEKLRMWSPVDPSTFPRNGKSAVKVIPNGRPPAAAAAAEL
jgi:two-component system chemotaxis response regulator CheB